MWNDNITSSDFIDFQHLVSAVSSIIDNDNLLPCSIGIFGDWGSGKSSLMKMVEQKYEGNDNILNINFNGWLFEGYEDTKTVLMSQIIDEIIKNRTLGVKALKIVKGLLKRIDYIKIGQSAIKHGVGFMAMGPVGLGLATTSDLINKLGEVDYDKYIKKKGENSDDQSKLNIQDFHTGFKELIEETKIEKIIVYIDDLDRCSPDTVIGILEAIKLFLFTEKTAFIIGADERLIKHAVRRRFPEIPGDNTEVGRDYLEKLIQYPIRIPPLSDLELTIYVNLLFTNLYTDVGEFEYVREEVMKRKNKDQFSFTFNINNINDFVKNVDESLKESLIMSAQIIPVLAVGLNGNPRQTKRFLNTMLLRHKMAESKGEELDKRILAKLMLLEYFKSETFKNFYKQQVENGGVIPHIGKLEELSKADELKSEELELEEKNYLNDNWLKKWFVSEPTLSEIDLQSYFYYSRDKLSVTGVSLQRMSSKAQDLFKQLQSKSEAHKIKAIEESKSLSHGDILAIFEGLLEKINNEGKQKGEKSTLKILFDFCKINNTLISQLLDFIRKLPHKILPIAVVSWILDLTEDTKHLEIATKILNNWSESKSNKNLAKIAKHKKDN